MGNDFSKGVDSAVSIITGIITGGLAGASAPWLAEQIKLHTGHIYPTLLIMAKAEVLNLL
ncbi:hypothetical protein DKK70_09240 [Gilliamella apicola]|uniref:Uncharacterized protein n=1 Tax=Gilliamella apicola TaxID=1196095 RepID=A0A2V4E131_9GAMM|nr:hypothetical protein [Gilliamella apicola]PXZ06845.1 hypothetical protein DKK70_09240 [Gilliamella apicola]